jgi:hypothetical protein
MDTGTQPEDWLAELSLKPIELTDLRAGLPPSTSATPVVAQVTSAGAPPPPPMAIAIPIPDSAVSPVEPPATAAAVAQPTPIAEPAPAVPPSPAAQPAPVAQPAPIAQPEHIAQPTPAAPQAPAAPPSPAAAPAAASMPADPRAAAVLRALADYDAVANGPGGGDTAAAAQHLLHELAQLRGSAQGVFEQRRIELWGQVVAARTAYADTLNGTAMPNNLDAQAGLAQAEAEQREVDDAEAKARKSLSGPSAFKRYAVAKRKLAETLDRFGVTSIEELRMLIGGLYEASPATLAEAAHAVAVAEAAFNNAGPAGQGDLPPTNEADAFRARAYRVIGRIVTDAELEPALQALAHNRHIADQAKAQVAVALGGLGIPAGDDPVTAARAIASVLRLQ